MSITSNGTNCWAQNDCVSCTVREVSLMVNAESNHTLAADEHLELRSQQGQGQTHVNIVPSSAMDIFQVVQIWYLAGSD